MTAKIYAPPAELGEPPDLDTNDIDGSLQREEDWVQRVRDWAKQFGTGALAGEEVRWTQGDGYARYVVYAERPLSLIHLPVGDAWQFPYVERLTLGDVRQQVQRIQGLARLFSRSAPKSD